LSTCDAAPPPECIEPSLRRYPDDAGIRFHSLVPTPPHPLFNALYVAAPITTMMQCVSQCIRPYM